MPPVVLQILFFFVAGACVLGILFFVSLGEKGTEYTDPSSSKIGPAIASGEGSGFKNVLAASLASTKKTSQLFRNFFKQPRDIFVHTREVIDKVRGEARPSVLDKTFEQDPERKFSLQDVESPTIKAKTFGFGAILKKKQAPKLVQKLQNKFEERGVAEAEKNTKANNEEEFWLGILRQNPHVAHPYKKLGEIYLKRGDYKEAHASLSFALTKDPNDQEAAALLTQVKEKRGGVK